MTGSKTSLGYSAGETAFPNSSTKGNIAPLGAVGNEIECNKDGKTLYSKNGCGMLPAAADSLIVRRREILSASDLSSKPSSPSTKFAMGLFDQRPAVAASETKAAVDRRVRGFGFSIRFHRGNSMRGMEPDEDGVGCAARLGKGAPGLYRTYRSRARRYVSDCAGSALSALSGRVTSLKILTHSLRAPHPPFLTSGAEISPTSPGATPPRPHSTPAASSFWVKRSNPLSLHSIAGVTNIDDGRR